MGTLVQLYIYFKFGGATLPDPDTVNPGEQGTFPIPTNKQQTVQISNPEKASPYATLHSWDFRRGIITSKAFKRMCENQETDTDFQTDAEPPKRKRRHSSPATVSSHKKKKSKRSRPVSAHSAKKIPAKTPKKRQRTSLQLIKHQQHKQQKIKQHLLQLILDIKNKQKMLQLQTGVLE